MRFMKNALLVACSLCFCLLADAQDVRYGFKIGLNNANIDGPTIEGEKFSSKSGFHIGMTAGLKFNDYFNVRAELLYSRRGTEYVYGTESMPTPTFRRFYNDNSSVFTTGTGDYALSVDNSYFELPITARFRYKKFEIGGGIAPSILVGSVADGVLHYRGTNANGSPTGELEYVLQYNYRKDDPGEIGNGALNQVTVAGQVFDEPQILKAYTDFEEKPERPYNLFDMGALADISYFFNSTLYLQARMYYGLSDVSNNNSDVRLDAAGDQNEYLFSDDFDRTFMIQASVGFSF